MWIKLKGLSFPRDLVFPLPVIELWLYSASMAQKEFICLHFLKYSPVKEQHSC